jgi:hypothetical protein
MITSSSDGSSYVAAITTRSIINESGIESYLGYKHCRSILVKSEILTSLVR